MSDKKHRSFWLISSYLFPVLILAIGIILAILWWNKKEPLVVPVVNWVNTNFHQNKDRNKIVYGFLPYWNLEKVDLQPELTHLSYFSLTIDGDGNILTRDKDNPEAGEIGYLKLDSDNFKEVSDELAQQGKQLELTLTQFDEDDISKLLTTKKSQQQFLVSLDNILIIYNVSGLNIDIECSGSECQKLQQPMADFMALVHQYLAEKHPDVNLSLDVYANAPKKTNIWDPKKLEPFVDHFIVMAYDFHRKTSPQAGPVAPIFGGQKNWDSDITTNLKDLLSSVPNKKILLGVPFYGYQWQTVSREPQAHTYPDTGATVYLDFVADLIQNKEIYKLEEGWSDEALSPFVTYEDDDEFYIIYYENSRSLGYKLELVNQLDLGGVAIWALGYEGQSRELWDAIKAKY